MSIKNLYITTKQQKIKKSLAIKIKTDIVQSDNALSIAIPIVF